MNQEYQKIVVTGILENYGIDVTAIKPAPRGFVAETFYVDNAEQRLFLKIRKNDSNSFKESLQVLAALNQVGVESIPRLLLTNKGDVGFEYQGKYASLFECLPGKLSNKYSSKKLAKILVAVHKHTGSIQIEVKQETFNIDYQNKYKTTLGDAVATGFPPVVSLQNEYAARLKNLHIELIALSDNLRVSIANYKFSISSALNLCGNRVLSASDTFFKNCSSVSNIQSKIPVSFNIW